MDDARARSAMQAELEEKRKTREALEDIAKSLKHLTAIFISVQEGAAPIWAVAAPVLTKALEDEKARN